MRSSGTKMARTSMPAPTMNAFAGRSVLSINPWCLDRMIFLGGDPLDRAIRKFMIHDQAERPRQGPRGGRNARFPASDHHEP